MEKFEYNGEIFYHKNGSFYDESFIGISEKQQQEIATAYFSEMDFKGYDTDNLFKYIMNTKYAKLYNLTIEAGRYALRRFEDDIPFLKNILPILTSAYRQQGMSQTAIKLAKYYLTDTRYSSVMLLTSLAAAYCDINDYRNAKKYADIAYARQGGTAGYKNELSLVYQRIQNATDI